ncbi:MAG: hypothetical protein HQL20_03185 [Candidatus Omnitrophica bacterium]|nr:hypothetical protein [Candidatus Omnitrophota bacterium]
MAVKNSSNVKFEIGFYEKVLERAPNFIEALICLGDLYTRAGLYSQGLAIDERLAALRPDDAGVLYNLACSYSLLNNIPLARSVMLRAIDLGYDEWEHLGKDTDLANLLGDREFIARLKDIRKKGARESARVPGL